MIGRAAGHLVALSSQGFTRSAAPGGQHPFLGTGQQVFGGDDLINQAGGLGGFGVRELAFQQEGGGAMAPSLRASRVVPPAPGKMPTMISGRPILAFGLSAAMMRWHDSGSSSPMPRAVPGSAATMGLPPFFRLGVHARKLDLAQDLVHLHDAIENGLRPAARICAMTFRSMPPGEILFPEVMMTPLTAGSASAVSIRPERARNASVDMTFIDFWATSR